MKSKTVLVTAILLALNLSFAEDDLDKYLERDPKLVQIERGRKIGNIMTGVGAVEIVGGIAFAIIQDDKILNLEFGPGAKDNSAKNIIGYTLYASGGIIASAGIILKYVFNKLEYRYYKNQSNLPKLDISVEPGRVALVYRF